MEAFMNYGKHPYLLINDVDLKQKSKSSSFLWLPILEKANKDLVEPVIIPHDPDGWLWEVLDKTKERILRGCITFKVTSEKKYFESMKTQLWCLIDQWPWIEKFHNEELGLEADLRTGIIMYTLGLVYDWMYHDFTETERKRVLNAIVNKGYPMLKRDIEADVFYLTSYGNNWLAIMLGGFGTAALATVDECDFSKQIIKLATERTKIMATYVGEDGAWEEGPFYWGGIAFLVIFFDILDSLPSSRAKLLNRDNLMKTSTFPIYMNMPPGGRANFSDAHYHQDHNASYLFAIMAKAAKNPYYQWAFHEFRNVADCNKVELKKLGIYNFRTPEETYQFLSYDENLKPKYPSTWPLFKLFQGKTYGFAASRSGFGRNDNGLVLCANGGTNGTNHHQLDIGQIIMTYKKHNFIYDPGYGRAFYLPDKTRVSLQNYFAKSSMGHNIITINGQSQIDSPKAKGTIMNCISNEKMGFFEIEMSSAYSDCNSAVRIIKRFRSTDKIEVEDIFNLERKLPARLAWFYKGTAEVIDDKNVVIKHKNEECRLNIESTEPVKVSLEFYSEKGYIDRNNQLLPADTHNYISIKMNPNIQHHIKTTFFFS